MKKFTDEELSRILSANEIGYLNFPRAKLSDYSIPGHGCLMQIAFNESNTSISNYPGYSFIIDWFDELRHNNEIPKDPDTLLAKMEEIGIA